jgi:hypothetical protein
MRTVVLNNNNVVQNGQNNTLVYNFPTTASFDKSYVAVASVSMYYSWFNISSKYGNNTLSYRFPLTGATFQTVNIVIPDGLYEVSTLNQFLQYTMIANGHYLINNATGQNVYFIELLVNDARYKVQINTFAVPTSLPTGYQQPGNYPASYPSVRTTPEVTISSGLGIILGFPNPAIPLIPVYNNASSAPNTITTDFQAVSTLSTGTPNVQPNSSVLVSVDKVDNPYSSPTSVIYSITPSVAVGSIIADKPPQLLWNKMIRGQYSQLRLVLLGTDLSPLQIQDGAITIILAIAEEAEALGVVLAK